MLGPSPPPPPPPLTTPLARKCAAASAAATDASRGRSGWCSPMAAGVGHGAGGAQRVRVLGGGSEAAWRRPLALLGRRHRRHAIVRVGAGVELRHRPSCGIHARPRGRRRRRRGVRERAAAERRAAAHDRLHPRGLPAALARRRGRLLAELRHHRLEHLLLLRRRARQVVVQLAREAADLRAVRRRRDVAVVKSRLQRGSASLSIVSHHHCSAATQNALSCGEPADGSLSASAILQQRRTRRRRRAIAATAESAAESDRSMRHSFT